MKHPNKINLMTPAESRSRGWAAEARDEDGHLVNQHAPFTSDAQFTNYVREAIEDGLTVTIWPIPIQNQRMLVDNHLEGTMH